MTTLSPSSSNFTGLIAVFHDASKYELSLLETDAGTFKIEDECLKVEYYKDGVQTQRGFPLCALRNYEIYFDSSSEE